MAEKRRARGEGGLVQRHDHPTCPKIVDGVRPAHTCRGRWAATVDVRLPDGSVKRKTVYGKTQTEARRALSKMVRERDEGTLIVNTSTVEGWVNHWYSDIASRTLKPQTLRGYRGFLDNHIIPHLGRKKLDKITPAELRLWHDQLAAKGLAPATVRQAHMILKKALKDAVYEGLLVVSPADRVKSPQAPRQYREGLSFDQARMVLKAAGDEPRWWLAVFCGMRQGEVLGLRWCDLDFARKTITIAQTRQALPGGGWTFGTPKSRAGARTIPMLPQIEARLKVHALSLVETPDADDLVFPGRDGGPRDTKGDWKQWRALLDHASTPPWAPIPQVPLHAARNTAASLMEAAGIPDRVVAQILGHSQVQITHGYQNADLDRMRDELNKAARVLALE